MDILRQSVPMKLNNERFNALRKAEEQEAWLEEFYEIGSGSPSRPYIGSKQNILATRDIAALSRFLAGRPFKVVRLRCDNLNTQRKPREKRERLAGQFIKAPRDSVRRISIPIYS
jgi:hypothetical protein